jgi:hypothetical protein
MRTESWKRSLEDDVALMAAVEHAKRRNRRRRGASPWDLEEWIAYGDEPIPGADEVDWEGNEAPG